MIKKRPMAVSIWHQQTIKYIKIENQQKNKCYHTSPGFLTVKIYLYSEQSGSVPGTSSDHVTMKLNYGYIELDNSTSLLVAPFINMDWL